MHLRCDRYAGFPEDSDAPIAIRSCRFTLASVPKDLNDLPLRPPAPEPKAPTPAPAWVALLATWMGLIMLILSIVFLFLPGSTDARAELEHKSSYSAKDWFLPIPIYGIAMAMFLGFVVIWQMRKEPRPLPQPMVY